MTLGNFVWKLISEKQNPHGIFKIIKIFYWLVFEKCFVPVS